MKLSPSIPHAFGCRTCTEARRDALAAKQIAARLLTMLAVAEDREAKQRQEIGRLEELLTRHAPKWEAESA